MSRARGYRDALQSFVGGYQEGLKEAMERAAKDDAVWKMEAERGEPETGGEGGAKGVTGGKVGGDVDARNFS